VRSHCRKGKPVGFGVNSHRCTYSQHTNAGEKSHRHELIVQTDHLNMQLDERRNGKSNYFISCIQNCYLLPDLFSG
jgi:hypothetical protein